MALGTSFRVDAYGDFQVVPFYWTLFHASISENRCSNNTLRPSASSCMINYSGLFVSNTSGSSHRLIDCYYLQPLSKIETINLSPADYSHPLFVCGVDQYQVTTKHIKHIDIIRNDKNPATGDEYDITTEREGKGEWETAGFIDGLSRRCSSPRRNHR